MSKCTSQRMCNFWSLLFWSILLHSVVVSSGHDDHPCTSVFHVWQPGQDAQRTIRELHLRMDNVTSHSQLQVAELRAHLSDEVNKINNWTFTVDKRILEMQASDMDEEVIQMKYEAGLARIQTEIDHTVRRVDDLESSIYNIRSKLRTSRWGNSANSPQQDQDNNHQRKGAVGEHLSSMLKDSISDLKAEWLLLKRDVEGLKKEEKRQKKHLQQLKDGKISLKTSLDEATSINKNIQTSTSEIKKTQTAMQERMDVLARDTFQLQHLVDDFKKYLQEQKESLSSVHTLSQTLKERLDEMDNQRMADIAVESFNDVIQKMDDSSRSEQTGKNHEMVTKSWTKKGHGSTQAGVMKDCHDVYRAGFRVSSIYHIHPDGMKFSLPVYCLIVNGTGYTLIQRRLDGTINFNRRWMEYRQGFGNPYGEIWMGNEFLHYITKQKRYILRVDLWDWEGDQFYAEYKKFRVDGEVDQYRLHIGSYSGNSGDSMSYHDKMSFSTEDVDNDLHQRHCGAENKGGWWFNSCFLSHLNGLYHTGWYAQTQSNFADGLVWFTLKNSEFYSLRKVEMTLKPLEM